MPCRVHSGGRYGAFPDQTSYRADARLHAHGFACVSSSQIRPQGLGKTLQGITLLWTLLNSGHELLGGFPIAKRVIIVCPTSLVNNWCAWPSVRQHCHHERCAWSERVVSKTEHLSLLHCRDAECTKWLQVT